MRVETAEEKRAKFLEGLFRREARGCLALDGVGKSHQRFQEIYRCQAPLLGTIQEELIRDQHLRLFFGGEHEEHGNRKEGRRGWGGGGEPPENLRFVLEGNTKMKNGA